MRIDDIDVIKQILTPLSKTVVNELEDSNNYVLFRKHLTHSDVINKGKPSKFDKDNNPNEYYKKYLLYYDSVKELKEIVNKKKIKIPIAHQSNITSKDFLDYIGMEREKDLSKPKINIVDEYKCQVPLDSLKDFTLDSIKKIAEKNGKEYYDENQLERIKLKEYSSAGLWELNSIIIAAHGIGVVADKEFYSLRSTMMKGDVLNLLVLKQKKKIYIIPERNEVFYLIKDNPLSASELPIFNESYFQSGTKVTTTEIKKDLIEYLSLLEQLENQIDSQDVELLNEEFMNSLKDQINKYEVEGYPKYKRWYQQQWKLALIKSYSLQFGIKNNLIFRCAITGITSKSLLPGNVFVASHIKDYKACLDDNKWDEAYDPNNGLILISNVDKLFDKFDFTIKKDGTLIFGNACNDIIDYKNTIFRAGNKLKIFYLNPKREKYLEYHRKKYFEKQNI